MPSLKSQDLQNVVITTVKPAKKSEHAQIVPPSFLDLFLTVDSYFPIVFFYEPTGLESEEKDSAHSKQVGQLKDSLSKLLVPYFPFAGRWVKTYDTRVRELQCNDEGVPFIEARMDEDMEAEMGGIDSFRPNVMLGGHHLLGFDANTFYQVDAEFPLPALFVQVTEFKCGGMALHVTFLHQTDGKAMMDFLSAWSQIAMKGETSILPVHDRTLVDASVEDIFARAIAAGSYAAPSEIESNESVSGSDGSRSDPANALRISKRAPQVVKTFQVRADAVQDLKKQAKAESEDSYVTTQDCITSHLWRSLNSLDTEKPESEFVAIFSMEGRKRLFEPSLPDHYAGTGIIIVLIPSVMTAEELASSSHLFAAKLVRQVVNAVTPENWRPLMDDPLELMQDLDESKFFLVSSWLKFPIYEIEFGHGVGKPVLASINLATFFTDSYCVVTPPRPGSSSAATVMFGFPEHMSKSLLSSPSFCSFFEHFEV